MKWNLPPEPDKQPDVEFFQYLADGAPVMIWMAGLDMGCFYFNRSWLDYRGRTLQQESGNGWAEGVHPEDLDRCVQHYVSSFERRVPFAMSYRLLHHSGQYRWILDRGAPHFGADDGFLGFYGGCAETSADDSIARIMELRRVLQQMSASAERISAVEAQKLSSAGPSLESLPAKVRALNYEYAARQHAAAEIGRLASDMLVYDRISKGVCLR